MLRVGALVTGMDFESYKWYLRQISLILVLFACRNHIACWKVPKSIETLADIGGVTDLTDADRQQLSQMVIGTTLSSVVYG